MHHTRLLSLIKVFIISSEANDPVPWFANQDYLAICIACHFAEWVTRSYATPIVFPSASITQTSYMDLRACSLMMPTTICGPLLYASEKLLEGTSAETRSCIQSTSDLRTNL
ncbi:uncharacterized protein PGTG_01225 [Puccinia graminis f. sp. tritici CRL 75-36-700-3]|uniref:Uncharacterized protein n=1 Tax=Puccinia graminis f. sp. tritici (strain CRL 75-36-700-3 / race SCCL) TaxID=418459 RepID=E3JV19_PUCGT|nr:uncharacterized protein PGTG_01225 [Puccinia graminis f. sp. tritici CRL 75-36-700-3]EFP75894.1 hypothetical protein PGTG_01225 [Puccinia graminis f. sp. tritici CRL 75-36-700-3]